MKRVLLVMSLLLGAAASGMPLAALAASPAPAATPTATPAAPRPLNLITSPLPINLVADPGTTISTDIRVKQGGSDTEQLKVSLMKFAAFGDAGKPRLQDRGPNDDYFDWVHFSTTSFAAPSNVWETIHMTINLPKSAQFGYYYAVVFTRAGDDTRPDKGAAIAGGTAVLVLLDARVPNAKRDIELVSFGVEHRLYEFLPSSFDITFHNAGNVHLQPGGDIFIKQGSRTIATLPINGEGGNILPASNRIFQVDWTDGFPYFAPVVNNGKVEMKNGKQVKQLVWDFGKANHLRIGRYTAELDAVYDNGQRDVPIVASITFWVLPWKWLLVLLIVLIVIGFGLFTGGRSIWRRLRRMRGSNPSNR